MYKSVGKVTMDLMDMHSDWMSSPPLALELIL